MTDTKNPGDTLSVSNPNQGSKTLTLKRPSSAPDTVRQSFSHGRTKTVVVETVKRRPTGAPPAPQAAPAAPLRPAAPPAPVAPTPVAPVAAAPAQPVAPAAPVVRPP
ncbi:MAG: translation initiation factor IF-2 associated domain-containing protein, partial [Labrys sp. (in: a-proteobacteria)]